MDKDDNSIDTEALQAQIDLSMSFAQSLVSSWMAPLKLPPSPRKRDLEKDLSEYMKRPPRLGVGASIPEGHQNLSREAARLKGKLSGPGKRLREGEEHGPAKLVDDDEDESRAGAIRKKQRPDPFDFTHGKKKGKRHTKNEESEEGKPTVSVVQSSSSQNSQDDVMKPEPFFDGAQLPSKKQEHPKRQSLIPNNDSALQQGPALLEEDSSNNGCSAKSVTRLPVVTSPSRRLSESDRKVGPTSPTSAPRNPVHAELLKRPLLNLTGPPTNSDDDETDAAEAGATESGLTSPKKKRKRRKKKKHHPITELASQSTTTTLST